uniref:DNA repair protein XRCC1-like n=1 Tax=Styela clava TaxID=7725 RepID=UPI0019398A50|nr:DNA repair protein XRCC1-like [Styela clava]
MPVVKIKHIVSFSSEETPHKADNLLSEDSSRKWKCAAGEKQACIVFQLEKSTQLSSIDIANEGSAFIEVLVGRSSNDNVQYQVILVASSFMSPQESRQGSPPNRVRIFNKDKLTSDIASQKWDLVKVVCTQPFNKRSTYGLSFIKFHTTDDDIEEKEPEVPVKQKTNDGRKTFGSFKIKEESDDSQSIPPGMSMKMYQMAKKENLNTSWYPCQPNVPLICLTLDGHTSSEDEGKDESVSNKIAQQADSDDVEEEEDPYGASTDEEAGDTEDEIEKVKARQKDPVKVENDANDEDPYNASTDEEPETNNHAENGLPELPDYFNDKTFMMYGKFASKIGRLTRRHIIACGGKITEYMNEDVEYIITEQPWDDNFDQALTENAGLVFVRPGWLFQCGAQQRIISYQPYAVSPS